MLPVASWTVACTSGRMPRRRTARAEIARTCTATVACSPGASAATVRASRLSRGRCSSSSPTVVRPSVRIPSASLPAGSFSGSSRRSGRGQRTAAADISSRLSALPSAKARGPEAASSPARSALVKESVMVVAGIARG